MQKYLSVLLLAFCASALLAGEEPAPPTVVVRERTVYVPYEKLKETFEKEGRGVFLPYEEFLKLWNAGQPKEKTPDEVKPPADAVISGGNYTGTTKENAARFEVTYKIRALGKNWSELLLPLKNVAVETVTLSDPLAVFAPKGDGYSLILPKPGEYTLMLAFSVRVDSKPGQRKIEFGIPPTAVSRLELTIPEKDLRVEVTPKMAATVAKPEGEGTKVLAFVGNADQVTLTWMPPVSKVEKGESITIASQTMHVELGERTLRLDTALSYKIERNDEDTFRIKLPENMRLLSVKGANIREWSSEAGVLVVRLHSPAKENYALALRFERILEKTPESLNIPFPVTVGTLREDGFLTVASESGLRLRVETAAGLSQIDPRELPEPLRRANLLAGFRYLAHPLNLALKIETVEPQIQSSVKAIISLGQDEDGLTGWVDYDIAKVGIFTAKLKFDSRWEVVSVGDPQTVEDFQAAVEGQYKVLSVNLKNKAIGAFRLPFKLTAPGRASAGQLTLESIQVLGTHQDKGTLGVCAPKAFKLTTSSREKMAPESVQSLMASGLLAQVPADYELPLAYSYTQQPASVKIDLARRETEIRVTGYHTVVVSEAGLEFTHKLEFFVQFAGVDRLQFSVPSALDEKIYDIKCAGLKEKKKLSTENGRSTWEILLQDKVLGVVPVFISHKENLKGLEPEKPYELTLPDVRAEGVAGQQGFIAVLKEAALEIWPKATGLEPLETVNVPPEMRPKTGTSNMYLAYRYFQPERSLSLKLTRHVPVDTASLIVDLLQTELLVSDERMLTAKADLWIQNAKAEQYLVLDLPKNAQIRSLGVRGALVNPLQREGGGTLVKLPAGVGGCQVQIIYSAPLDESKSGAKMGLAGGLDLRAVGVLGGVPVSKIEAAVYVPEDYAYMGLGGTMHLRKTPDRISNTLAWLTGFKGDASVRQPHLQHVPPPLVGAFNPQGRAFYFQTLAPAGQISMTYFDRKLFWIFDIAIFVAALALGWFLCERRKLPRFWVCAGEIVVPLCLGWLVVSDAREICTSWTLAGVILAGVYALKRGREAWLAWKELRIATAPDPFIEDAPEKPQSPAKEAEGAAPKDAPPEPPATPSAEEPKPSDDTPKAGGAQ
ncbi:MAG TPA: hypothetical protein VGP72_29585 [Planctomycetota bacterium]